MSAATPREYLDSPRTSIDALTGIRILAAGWVVLFHLREGGVLPSLLPGSERIGWFIEGGYLGVDLFFALSGFVIAYNYLDRFGHFDRRAYGRFLYLRLARIYPVHLVTLLFLLLMVVGARAANVQLGNDRIYGAGDFVANLLLLHAWGTDETSWNYPAWSISAEWFAYLLFPLIAVAFARLRVTSAPRALAGAVIALAVGLPLLEAAPGDWNALIRITTEFLTGCFLFVLYRHTRQRSRLYAWLLPAGFLVVVALVALTDARTLLVAPVLVFVVWAASQAGGPVARWLASRPMVFWGQASYSLYMTHALVIIVLNQALSPEAHADASLPTRLALLAGYVVVLAVVAAATFVVIERRSREWLRTRLRIAERRHDARETEQSASPPASPPSPVDGG